MYIKQSTHEPSVTAQRGLGNPPVLGVAGFRLRVLKLETQIWPLGSPLTGSLTYRNYLPFVNLSLFTYKMGTVILQIVLRIEVIHDAKGFWLWLPYEKVLKSANIICDDKLSIDYWNYTRSQCSLTFIFSLPCKGLFDPQSSLKFTLYF